MLSSLLTTLIAAATVAQAAHYPGRGFKECGRTCPALPAGISISGEFRVGEGRLEEVQAGAEESRRGSHSCVRGLRRAWEVKISTEGLSINGVPAAARNKWMRVALDAVKEIRGEPCGLFPFGVAVVNTTSDELVCVAANAVGVTGNPSMHGEITGLHRCTEELTAKGLTPQEILSSWKDFTMYTTGEPCPMCASALRWAGMGEVVWATSIETIIKGGRNQIYIPSSMIVSASYSLPHQTLWLGSVLANETDPYFTYQFNETAACPSECTRELLPGKRVSECVANPEWKAAWKKTEGEWEAELMRTKGHPERSVAGHDEL